jgi:hypothetical protein
MLPYTLSGFSIGILKGGILKIDFRGPAFSLELAFLNGLFYGILYKVIIPVIVKRLLGSDNRFYLELQLIVA